jgi:hypothetical protein
MFSAVRMAAFSRKGVPNLERCPVLFFKTQPPVEPVSFIHKICTDAFESANIKKHRWIRRLTPMSQMGKATEKGLDAVSKAVLGPAFHQEGIAPKKVCIPVLHFPESSMGTFAEGGCCAEPGWKGILGAAS